MIIANRKCNNRKKGDQITKTKGVGRGGGEGGGVTVKRRPVAKKRKHSYRK